MKFSRSNVRPTHAFTLIELILAIGVTAIVLVAINAVFFASLNLREATSKAVEEATPLDAALTLLRRDLRCAVPPGSNSVIVGDFKAGDIASLGVVDLVNLELYTATGALNSDPAQPWGDVQRVTYGLKTPVPANGQGKDLIRTVTRNLLSETTPEIEEQWMLGNVQSLKIQCFDGQQWSDQWDTSTTSTSLKTNLPLAVRVRLQMAANNPQPLAPVEIFVPIDSQSRTNT
jgi:type II secretion system protein J